MNGHRRLAAAAWRLPLAAAHDIIRDTNDWIAVTQRRDMPALAANQVWGYAYFGDVRNTSTVKLAKVTGLAGAWSGLCPLRYGALWDRMVKERAALPP